MVVVQWLSCVRLFVTPWPAACQALLSSTISQSLLKFISIKWVMLSNRLIFCHSLLLLPSVFSGIRGFASELALHSVGQSIGVLASASVLPVNIQCWFPLGVTSLIFLLSKGLSKVLKSTSYKHQLFSTQPSLWSNSTFIRDYWKNHSFDCIDLCQQIDVTTF